MLRGQILASVDFKPCNRRTDHKVRRGSSPKLASGCSESPTYRACKGDGENYDNAIAGLQPDAKPYTQMMKLITAMEESIKHTKAAKKREVK